MTTIAVLLAGLLSIGLTFWWQVIVWVGILGARFIFMPSYSLTVLCGWEGLMFRVGDYLAEGDEPLLEEQAEDPCG